MVHDQNQEVGRRNMVKATNVCALRSRPWNGDDREPTDVEGY